MPSDSDLANRFYDALRTADAQTLIGLLHPDFEGHVTEGLPAGIGGIYRGPESMLRDCWGRVAQLLPTAHPEPEQLFETADGWVIARGRYLGGPRAGHLNAVFAHFLRFDDGRLVELWQITDSNRWAEAVGNPDTIAVAEHR